jgi:hypothetical protein
MEWDKDDLCWMTQQINQANARGEIFSGCPPALLRHASRNNPMYYLPSSTREIVDVLNDRENLYLGHGTFSRVFSMGNDRVIKFTRDKRNFELLQRLADKSPYFPRVEAIWSDQAHDERGFIYHAAIIERLVECKPKWVNKIVDSYRSPNHCHLPIEASHRLLDICKGIDDGSIILPEHESNDFKAALKILAAECISEQLLPDLRTSTNFMTRMDGHLVMADPAHPIDIMLDYR